MCIHGRAYEHIRTCLHSYTNHMFTLDLDTSRDPLGQFRRLEKLESLNLENNNITDIPLELGVCKHLKAVMINGNPQRTVKVHNSCFS